MPNGHDKNWVRVCGAIDGFRSRYGKWPTRVRVMPLAFEDLKLNVLTPIGFALISSYVELIPGYDTPIIAEDAGGAEYSYGEEGFPDDPPPLRTRAWFGEAVLRQDSEPFSIKVDESLRIPNKPRVNRPDFSGDRCDSADSVPAELPTGSASR